MEKVCYGARIKKVEVEEGQVTPSGASAQKLKVSLVDGVLESFKIDLADDAAKYLRPGCEVDFGYSAEFGWSTGEAKGTSYLGVNVKAIRKGVLGQCVVEEGIEPQDFSMLAVKAKYVPPAPAGNTADDDDEVIV